MLHSCAPFLLVLLLVTSQSAGLSMSVSPNPVVLGQTATVTYTRSPGDPSSFNVAIQGAPISFPVDSKGQTNWNEPYQVPSNWPPGGPFTLQASSGGKSLGSSNPFTVVDADQASSNTPTHPTQGSVAASTSASSSSTESSILSTPSVSITIGTSSASSGVSSGSSSSGSSTTASTSLTTKQDSPAGADASGTGEDNSTVAPALSAAGISPSIGLTSDTIPPSFSSDQQPGSQPTSTPVSALSSSSSSKTARIVGGVIGALIALALLAFLAIFFVRRYRAKQRQNTVQFYQQRMVQPRQLDPALAHGNVSTNLISTTAAAPGPFTEGYGYQGDTKAPSEQLPEYGYSNYDIVEKADYYRTPEGGTSSAAYGGVGGATLA